MKSLAMEAQEMVMDAASANAGDSIGRQIRNASRALGYSDGNWRVRAAWYGEAGSWSGVAIEELRARYARWKEKQRALAVEKQQALAALFEAAATGPDHERLDREQAARLGSLARRMRDENTYKKGES